MEENVKKGTNLFKKILSILVLVIVFAAGFYAGDFFNEHFKKETQDTKVEVSTNDEKNVTNVAVSDSQSDVQIEKVEEDNKETETEVEKDEDTTETIEEPHNEVMKMNKAVKKKNAFEATYVGSGFSKVVNPPVKTSYYRYYEAKDGHTYLYIKINYKNLTTTSKKASEIAGIEIKYDEQYEYSAFPVMVDGDGDFTYANINSIEPLSKGKMYYLVEVPDEVAKSKKSIMAYVTIDSENYEIKIR